MFHPLSESLTFLGLRNCISRRIGQLEEYREWSNGADLFPYLTQSAGLWTWFRRGTCHSDFERTHYFVKCVMAK